MTTQTARSTDDAHVLALGDHDFGRRLPGTGVAGDVTVDAGGSDHRNLGAVVAGRLGDGGGR
jgi:hypothetical protein